MFGLGKGGKAPKMSRLWQTGLDDHVVSLAWAPDGKRLACALVGGSVKVLDAATGSVGHDLPGHGFGASEAT